MKTASSISIGELFSDFELPSTVSSVEVRDICLDSRAVTAGSIFFALKGQSLNREVFIDKAFELGAVAVVTESESSDQVLVCERNGQQRIELSLVGLQARMGVLASRFFKHPSDNVYLVGITGTNGKTSCAELLVQVWRQFGWKAASLGTLGWSYESGQYYSTGMTTLDAIENQRLLRKFVDDGITHVVMEVSSHGIDQGRICGLTFNTKVLTNISRDHLDYHSDMKSYAKVKLSFLTDTASLSIYNCDDECANHYLSPSEITPCICFSASNDGDLANVYPISKTLHERGISAAFKSQLGVVAFDAPLIGEFNIYNLLAVYAVISSGQHVDLVDVERAFNSLSAVAGRLERVSNQAAVFIDYAHTPDALENVLLALLAHRSTRLILVFGCGGDRDQGKRALMARVAEKYADVVVVTSDNPRSENPNDIVNDILKGMKQPQETIVEMDRKRAIAIALNMAEENDIVLVAGKGHENYQEIKGKRIPFSDHDEVKRLIA